MKNEDGSIVKRGYRVGSLGEALDLALDLKAKGTYDLFRGQASNWPVEATIYRVKSQKDYEKHLQRLELLYHFMSFNPVLSAFSESPDQIVAIAQHYGIATNFIDFTTDPEIAAYFATHSKGNKVGDDACIICVSRSDFSEFMVFVGKAFEKKYANGHPPEFLSIDVENLWRLQSQKGHFLYSPFAGFEKFYRFDRILFPYTAPYNGISESEVYPVEKSVLETNLDYFFMSEHRSANMKRITDWLGEDKVIHISGHDIFDYIAPSSMPHTSWNKKEARAWKKSFAEDWHKISKKITIKLKIPFRAIGNADDRKIAMIIESSLSLIDNVRNVLTKLDIQRIDRPFGKQMARKMEKGANLIWNGMRVLPYELSEIASCIARFIILLYKEPKFGYKGGYRPLMGRVVEVGLSGADLTHGRCFVSGLDVLGKVRRNIYGMIREKDREICRDNPIALLQLVTKPSYLFRFDGFKALFLRDAIPSQVLKHIESRHPVIYFNPYFVETFGLA